MKKRAPFIIFMILIVVSTSGCWDYREINKLSIVTGLAIDRGENSKYKITFEIVDTQEGGIEDKIKSKLIESEGETIFEVIRNSLKVSSPRLYFGHLKVVILSEQIAREGVTEIIDFLDRDAEPRLNIDLMVSKEKTAREILSAQSTTEALRSFEIEQTLKQQDNLSESPRVRVYQFVNYLPCKGIAPVLPVMEIVESAGKKTFALSGTAVFKGDKLAGYLNEEESNFYCYVTDNVKRGIIILKDFPETEGVDVTLEIYDSVTKVKPVYSDGKISMDIMIKVSTAIAEQTGSIKSESGIEVLKVQKAAEEYLKSNTVRTVQSVQKKFGLDIFGFGKKINSEMPKLWKEISQDWNSIYKEIDINVSASVEVKNRGLMKYPIVVGEE